MNPFVETSLQGQIARIVLRRPDKLNALNREMVDALGEAARAIEASREVRAAVLFGEGKAFCVGGDIAAWGDCASRRAVTGKPAPVYASQEMRHRTRLVHFYDRAHYPSLQAGRQ